MIERCRRLSDWWIRIWDLREAATVQALVRAALALVLLTDLVQIAWLDLVAQLLGPAEAGGFSIAMERQNPPLYYDLMAPTAASAWLLWGGMVASCAALAVGLFTRTSALVLLLLSAQTALILPPADRGIDMLIRNVLLVLVFSSAGRAWSADARLATGSWRGDGRPVPAWPRHLLVLQLVLMYFTAGIYKVGYLWTPMGRFDALYVILQDPAVARADWGWLVHEPFLLLTRVGTAVTVIWEWSAPIVLLAFVGRFHGAATGLLGWAARHRLHLWWLSVGVVFHVGIALTLDLGIFPWAMLALYPVFLHPSELEGAVESVLRRVSATGSRRPAP